jgi:hypothetical protein
VQSTKEFYMRRNGFILALLALACTVVLVSCGGSGGGAVKNPKGAAPSTDFSFDRSKTVGGVIITGYTGKGGEVVIPAVIEDAPVVRIGFRAFRGNDNITELVVPDSVIKIEEGAFASMSSLTGVTLPDDLKEIPHNLFCIDYATGDGIFCEKLTTVNLPVGLESVGDLAFSNARELINLTIPDSLTSIEFAYGNAFEGCGKLPLETRQRLRDLGYEGEF